MCLVVMLSCVPYLIRRTTPHQRGVLPCTWFCDNDDEGVMPCDVPYNKPYLPPNNNFVLSKRGLKSTIEHFQFFLTILYDLPSQTQVSQLFFRA